MRINILPFAVVIILLQISSVSIKAQATIPTEELADKLCKIFSEKSPSNDPAPSSSAQFQLMRCMKIAGEELPASLTLLLEKPNGSFNYSDEELLRQLLVSLLSNCPKFHEHYVRGIFKLNAKGKLDRKIPQASEESNHLVETILAFEESGIFKKINKDTKRTAVGSLHFFTGTNKRCLPFYQNRYILEGFSNFEIFTYFSKDYPEVALRFFKEDAYARLSAYSGGVQKADTAFADVKIQPLIPADAHRREIISKNLIAKYPDELIVSRGPFVFQGVELSPMEIRKRLEQSFVHAIDYYYSNKYSTDIPRETTLNLSLGTGLKLTKEQLAFIDETAMKICAITTNDTDILAYLKARSDDIIEVFPLRSANQTGIISSGENLFVSGIFKHAIKAYAKEFCR